MEEKTQLFLVKQFQLLDEDGKRKIKITIIHKENNEWYLPLAMEAKIKIQMFEMKQDIAVSSNLP